MAAPRAGYLGWGVRMGEPGFGMERMLDGSPGFGTKKETCQPGRASSWWDVEARGGTYHPGKAFSCWDAVPGVAAPVVSGGIPP